MTTYISTTILHYLRDHANEELTPAEIGTALDMDSRRVATSIRNCIHRMGKESEWSHVERVSRGVYVYREEQVHHARPIGWSVLAEDSGTFILKSPEEKLFIARPLVEESSA